MEDLVEGKFEAPIGHKIEYLNFLFCEREEGKEPVLAWMKTSDSTWHRFFIDAWMPNWFDTNIEDAKDYYDTDKIEDHIREELEEYEDKDGNNWIRVNVLNIFDLINKKIVNAETFYTKENGFAKTQLIIEIEDDKSIILNDYGDVTKSELIINGTKL